MIGCAIGKGLKLVITTAFELGTDAALVLAMA